METDLNKLRDKAYRCAKDHGFHDKEQSNEYFLMLIISEICEAISADRENKHADVEIFKSLQDSSAENYEWNFKFCFGGTVEDELADIAIRVFDLAGVLNISLTGIDVEIVDFDELSKRKNLNFVETMYDFTELIFKNKFPIHLRLKFILMSLMSYSKKFNIDLFQHIQWKMEYNELRPKFNGKEY